MKVKTYKQYFGSHNEKYGCKIITGLSRAAMDPKRGAPLYENFSEGEFRPMKLEVLDFSGHDGEDIGDYLSVEEIHGVDYMRVFLGKHPEWKLAGVELTDSIVCFEYVLYDKSGDPIDHLACDIDTLPPRLKFKVDFEETDEQPPETYVITLTNGIHPQVTYEYWRNGKKEYSSVMHKNHERITEAE